MDLKQALEAVIVIDTAFAVLQVNAAFTRLSGIKEKDALGEKCHDVFQGDMCNTQDCPMNSIRDGKKQLRYEADKH